MQATGKQGVAMKGRQTAIVTYRNKARGIYCMQLLIITLQSVSFIM